MHRTHSDVATVIFWALVVLTVAYDIQLVAARLLRLKKRAAGRHAGPGQDEYPEATSGLSEADKTTLAVFQAMNVEEDPKTEPDWAHLARNWKDTTGSFSALTDDDVVW